MLVLGKTCIIQAIGVKNGQVELHGLRQRRRSIRRSRDLVI